MVRFSATTSLALHHYLEYWEFAVRTTVTEMRQNCVRRVQLLGITPKTGRDLWLPFTPRLAAVLKHTRRDGLFILSQPDSQPVSYRAAAFAVMKVRKEIGAEEYDIHALRHTTASELAALGLSDELIMAVTGHTSRASVVRYAGAARQKARAQVAQDAWNRTKTKRKK